MNIMKPSYAIRKKHLEHGTFVSQQFGFFQYYLNPSHTALMFTFLG